MKYLITVTRRQSPAPLPLDAVPGIINAQREWLNERIADGTLDVVYAFPEGGGVAIANADSVEELNAALLSQPGFLLNDFAVRPLADLNTALTNAAEAIQRVVAAAPA